MDCSHPLLERIDEGVNKYFWQCTGCDKQFLISQISEVVPLELKVGDSLEIEDTLG